MKRIALVVVLLTMQPAVSFAQTKKNFPIYDNGGMPDLVIDGGRLLSTMDIVTRTFSDGACEFEEGSIIPGAGSHRLLRFDVAIANTGNGDLVVGDPTDASNEFAEWFVYALCHQHHHLTGFTDYQLLDRDGEVATRGHKQTFCLEDVVRYATGASHGYTCEHQGITSGWADVYTKYLSGQWIDITGLPAGEYTLRVVINASGTFDEGASANRGNVFEATVRIPEPRGKK